MNDKLDKFCDLHIHSNFSDSDRDTESIFKEAKEKGLSCIAITDHDTIAALPSAKIYSRRYNVELIEAIESSVQHKHYEVHILGYFIDPTNKKLLEELSQIRELRKERILTMADKLNSLGFKIDKDDLMLSIGESIPTRLHLALYLIKKSKAISLREIFKKYLSPGKPAYVARFKHSVKDIIRLIKDCGGLSFLAHPHMLPDQSWLEDFISLGLDGLEVVYPTMSGAKRSLYMNMVDKFGLLKSGGSDAHGSYKDFIQIGGVKIPYQWVQDMKNKISSAKSL